jgi:ribosomal protein L40E
MTPMGLPPIILILIVAIVIFLLIATASQHRRHTSLTDVRLCRGCGAGHPAFAQFCRRCGRKL